MKPGKYTLQLHQRTAFDWALTWRDDADSIVDLSSHGAVFQVRRDYLLADPIGELASIDGGITLSATSPNIIVHITRDFLVDLPSNNMEQEDWIYGLKIFVPNAENTSTQTLLEGRLILSPAAARVDT